MQIGVYPQDHWSLMRIELDRRELKNIANWYRLSGAGNGSGCGVCLISCAVWFPMCRRKWSEPDLGVNDRVGGSMSSLQNFCTRPRPTPKFPNSEGRKKRRPRKRIGRKTKIRKLVFGDRDSHWHSMCTPNCRTRPEHDSTVFMWSCAVSCSIWESIKNVLTRFPRCPCKTHIVTFMYPILPPNTC